MKIQMEQFTDFFNCSKYIRIYKNKIRTKRFENQSQQES